MLKINKMISRKLIVVFMFTHFVLSINAQEKQVKDLRHSFMYIGLGGMLSSFQDVKYSSVRYSGIGGNINFGYENTKKKNYFSTNFSLFFTSEKARTYDLGRALLLDALIDVSYLMPIIRKENQKVYLGAKWDVLDIYLRQTEDLMNNSFYYVSGSNLKIASLYERTLSDELSIRGGVSFQLISFMKESTSFGFSAPQDVLENGEFTYQDLALYNPFGFKHYNFEAFTKYINFETLLEVHYKQRWIISYKWNMQGSKKVPNYPMTKGYSSLSFRFKF